MNPNPLHAAGLLVLPILWLTLAGCTPIKAEQASQITPDASNGDRIDSNHQQQAPTVPLFLPIDQQIAANRSTPTVQTGRYSTLAAMPSPAQRHPLDVMIEVTIPETCISIEDAIHFLLRRSGYTLDTTQPADVIELLAKPLPAVHRTLAPIPLKDVLTVLVTPGFVLQDEPIKRLIRFIPITENRGRP